MEMRIERPAPTRPGRAVWYILAGVLLLIVATWAFQVGSDMNARAAGACTPPCQPSTPGTPALLGSLLAFTAAAVVVSVGIVCSFPEWLRVPPAEKKR
jgi:hypothetical protein